MSNPPNGQEPPSDPSPTSNSQEITTAWICARLARIGQGVTEVLEMKFSQEILESAADAALELGNGLLGLGFMEAWKAAMRLRHELQNPRDENFVPEDLIANVILLREQVELLNLEE